ncbi:GNAT family N-acetyltransferase [Hoyosella sp. G463]|uniref:GNAT family N-acetyltransferase n=2 Tax=Lolliginicoccus lacisalsi TaxID=2742202 RepID=A0A927JAM3_9ACTN|nr:GNAT family N-acetyltransferase [Lolliginicoccus lacisalsi]
MGGYASRILDIGGVRTAVEWAAAEGWNPGLHDADAFAAADTTGFRGAWWGDELVATISAVRYGAELGFIGFYIVSPHWRGRGIGYRLWGEAMASLADVPTVGLDAVVEQQEAYARSGFVRAFSSFRHGGVLEGRASARARSVTGAVRDALVAHDRQHFPAGRRAFLEAWWSLPDSHTRFIAVEGAVVASGTIRRCRDGWKVGPLFADSPGLAEELLDDLVACAGGRARVFLDAPEPNGAAGRLAAERGMEVVFETGRMYRGPDPGLPLPRIFGVTSFELG